MTTLLPRLSEYRPRHALAGWNPDGTLVEDLAAYRARERIVERINQQATRGRPPVTDGAMAAWITRQQDVLWDRLDDALRTAINGYWSISTANTALSIVQAARLVGPTDPGSVSYRLIAGGVYEAVLDVGNVPYPPLTEEQLAEWDEQMARHGMTREICRPEMAFSVSAIRSEREANWIAGGRE